MLTVARRKQTVLEESKRFSPSSSKARETGISVWDKFYLKEVDGKMRLRLKLFIL